MNYDEYNGAKEYVSKLDKELDDMIKRLPAEKSIIYIVRILIQTTLVECLKEADDSINRMASYYGENK